MIIYKLAIVHTYISLTFIFHTNDLSVDINIFQQCKLETMTENNSAEK